MKYSLLLPCFLLALISISCEKEVSTSPEDDLNPNYKLYIDSDPRGSKIYIDNRNSGQRTPDTISWLDKGNHLITLKSELLKDSNYIVTISEEMDSILFNFRTNPTMYGNLYLDSNPDGVEIYLNDSNTTLRTPRLMRGLFPGEYKITYKLPGYWDANASVLVVSERTITVNEKLVDTTIWVNYTNGNVGIPADEYNDIDIQDGYIKWIASRQTGLIRYDENKWTIYNTSNSSIPSNLVTSVEAADNGIWIGTDYGAAFLSNGNFTVYNSTNSPLPDIITCVHPAQGGKVWFGTDTKGIFSFDGVSWINYNKSNSPLITNRINTILVTNDGVVWIGTEGEGLYIFDGTNWSRVFNNLQSPKVDAVILNGTEIWIGSSYIEKIGQGSGIPPDPGGSTKVVYYFGGITVLSGGWSKYRQPGNDIVSLAVDDQGTIWYSDYTTGFGKKTAAGWQSYYNYTNINDIAIDGAGNKWLATRNRGIVKYKGN